MEVVIQFRSMARDGQNRPARCQALLPLLWRTLRLPQQNLMPKPIRILNAITSHRYFVRHQKNIRSGEWLDYTYNKRNRLSAVTRNSAAWATYGYNALEQLTTRVSTALAAPLARSPILTTMTTIS